MSIVLLWIATQIITESFPISSSSHTKLLESILDWCPEMPLYFGDFLHGPTLLILGLFFYRRWYVLLRHAFRLHKLFFSVVGRTAVASMMTVLIYFTFHFVPLPNYFPVPLGLMITMLSLFSLVWCPKNSYERYTVQKACILGLVQGCALLPGISRLGITFVCARWLRLSPRHAVEASFAMQAPLLIAAFIRASIFLISSSYTSQLLNATTGLVMIISSVIAYAGLYAFMYLARVHKVWLFAWYMSIPLVTWLVFIA